MGVVMSDGKFVAAVRTNKDKYHAEVLKRFDKVKACCCGLSQDETPSTDQDDDAAQVGIHSDAPYHKMDAGGEEGGFDMPVRQTISVGDDMTRDRTDSSVDVQMRSFRTS